jgi:uncharacterized protein (TIGR00725 family)
MGQIVIGVMGPGTDASPEEMDAAYKLGQQIGLRGWITLCGGRNCGVMDAVCRGAKSASGFTVGILPSETKANASSFLDLAIPTGMGSARNNMNVLASDVVVACGMGAGTASEVALALKAKKPVILLKSTAEAEAFFTALHVKRVVVASTIEEAITHIERILKELASGI